MTPNQEKQVANVDDFVTGPGERDIVLESVRAAIAENNRILCSSEYHIVKLKTRRFGVLRLTTTASICDGGLRDVAQFSLVTEKPLKWSDAIAVLKKYREVERNA